MSRSYKKPYIKDRGLTEYNRIIRSRINQLVRKMKYEDEVELPHPKTIINDYSICDYIWYMDEPKYTRK